MTRTDNQTKTRKAVSRKLCGDDLITNAQVRLERAAEDFAKDRARGEAYAEEQLHQAAVAYAVVLLSVRGGLTEDEG